MKPVYEKSYIALFVCFSTHAVHLETLSNLSADAFLAGLRLFVSRRGLPKTLYSDNGSNFVAVDSNLREAYAFLDSQLAKQKEATYLADHRVS